MENRNINRMYYLETFLLLAFFIATTMVLSNVFVTGKKLSMEARELTNAVTIAENTAEVTKASYTSGDLLSVYKQNGNYEVVSQSDREVKLKAFYDRDMKPAKEGYYRLELSYSSDNEKMCNGDIVIYRNSDDTEIYHIKVSNYFQEVIKDE